jgi:uncharacterized membrane protein YccC
MDRPDLAALSFLRGTALSGVVAFVCVFFVLTRVEGFPLLALVVAVIVSIAALFSTLPKHAGSAPAFLVYFSIFLAPSNPMRFDPVDTLNTIIAIGVGCLFAVTAFRTLWPLVPEQVARRLMRDIVEDLAALCRRPDAPETMAWESRMTDRLGRLSTRLAQSPRRLAVVEGGLAALQVGREIVRARRIRADLHLPPDIEASIARARETTRRLAAAPDRVAEASAAAARDLLAAATAAPSEAGETPPQAGEACAMLRVAAAFQAVSELLTRHRSFFDLSILDEPAPELAAAGRAEAA